MKYLFSAIFLSICSLYANESRAEFILSEYRDAIDHYSGDKIYIHPDKVFAEGDELYLYNEGSTFKIPRLYADVVGYYMLSGQVEEMLPYYKCTNKKCKFTWEIWEDNGKLICPRCGSRGRMK